MSKSIFAEDVNYWKTSKSSADAWLDRAKKQIESVKGKVYREAFISEEGQTAFLLCFKIGEDNFKLVWHVLESRTGDEKAAKVQAATLIYHDVKHACVMAKVKGARAAFSSYLILPNGQTVEELLQTPRQMQKLLLPSGEG